MALQIFGLESRLIFFGNLGGKTFLGHTMGSPEPYAGLEVCHGEPPVHVLFRLNMEDPAVNLTLPGLRWLPLLCAIRYGATEMGYRVVSDTEVKILFQKETKGWKGFPTDDYPERLPVEPLSLNEGNYDPDDPQMVFAYAGVFDPERLTPYQFSRTVAWVEQEELYDSSFMDEESAEEYVRTLSHPFMQGPPENACPDGSCPNHRKVGSMSMLAIFEEDLKRVGRIWNENIQLIFQTCPLCGAMHTINQCT